MKTSSSDTALIDRFLDDQLDIVEAARFAGRMHSDIHFRRDVMAQARLRELVGKHYREQLKRTAQQLHQQLYNDPARKSLRMVIDAIFT